MDSRCRGCIYHYDKLVLAERKIWLQDCCRWQNVDPHDRSFCGLYRKPTWWQRLIKRLFPKEVVL